MHFTHATTLLALSASLVSAAIPAQRMVENIDTITELSARTNEEAKRISVVNFFSTAPQLINNFRQIVQIASDDITSMNSKRDVINAKRQECLNVEDVQKCIEDLEEIPEDPSEILGDKRRRQAATNYTDAQQLAICSSFRTFVGVHQQLLATVIGKHGLLSLTPFTQPIAQVLRVLEGGVDVLAFGIIDAVPTCATDATQDKNALDRSLADAVDEYSN